MNRMPTPTHCQWAAPLAAILLALSTASPGRGAELEPWAGAAPPVVEGLALWLDASVQSAALQASGGAPLKPDEPLPQWLDSSGRQRHLAQTDVLARPAFYQDGSLATVRFSGRGAHFLEAFSPEKAIQSESLTVFLVAAPHRNEGNFSGLLSMHAAGEFDYTSGLNIDLGPGATPTFSILNVEGAGFGGAKNLRTGERPFPELRRLCVTSMPGPQGVTLSVDGGAEGRRDRTVSTLRGDRLIVGARSYGGDAVRSFFAGDIAEVLLYDRVLSDQEIAKVDQFLAAKYRDAPAIKPPLVVPGQRLLQAVENPPPVQMFVPGFVVRELPVQLTNINNVLYREDGALAALAYDGNVYLLRDTDGDGLEDEAKLFWKNEGQLRAPIGMALTPPGYQAPGREAGFGVFVPSKSKLSLLYDADGDDVAEEEIIVASGWKELWTQVDALGVAVDPRDQSIYFGLGTWNFANGHQVDDQGVAQYKLTDEHGTILHVAPDFKSREIVCTGIRFPVGMRFNKDDELFCTEQEGATWLPNGNPYDELLHIERGRHYGFPPRHPRHLPDVIDEPSVFDYRPQHQSTCGINFNEPARDGTIFGPDWWRSDALITGYSRGKLYRTRLARTDAGYIAQNQLIGTANMLTADACVAPDRSLVIAAHSGGPDWGSGPSGAGKLYKVTYADPTAAIPSLVWAQSPREVRIAFDRPLPPKMLKELSKRVRIDAGEFVAAGDRFESLRPGYAVVQRQMNAPRFGVDVQNVAVTGDGRTLILATAPQRAAVSYGVSLPGLAPTVSSENLPGALPQYPDVELQYDLCGVEATWQPTEGEPETLWIPHLDTSISQELTQASAEHRRFWNLVREQEGRLMLRTVVDLQHMLRPDVQPGAVLDYEYPAEEVNLLLACEGAADVVVDGKTVVGRNDSGSGDEFTVGSGDRTAKLEISLHVLADSLPVLSVNFSTKEDSRVRALALRRFLMPWAKLSEDSPENIDNRDLPELAGGNWLRGQKEFYGAQAACSKCHSVRGVGGKIGPDLSNLPLRDYASVLRDVTQPSFAINPDFTTQNVLLIDGRTLAGTVRNDGDRIIVSDTEGKETVVDRDEVDEMQHSPLSIMPEGIPKLLGESRLKDLLTFLLVAPPQMPVYGDLPPPPPRTMAEVEAVLADGDPQPASPRKLNIVLVAGTKDHGAGEHDYPAWKTQWQHLLQMDETLSVSVADDWPSAEQFAAADAIVFYQKGQWTPQRARDLDAFLARGGGATYIHYAVDGGNDPAGFAERIGLAWQGGRSKFRHGALDLDFAPGRDHPIARHFDKIHFYDESYWQPTGDPRRISLLATGVEEGQPQPLFWTRQHGGGRVFVSIPGHYSWTFDDPLFRLLLLRGIAWSAGESVDRFNALALPGARLAPTQR
jgi:putative heme-binding domain-containing protein